MVVDDEEGIREILREEFEFLGASVVDARNGREAFDQLSKQSVEVVVSDIRMPGGDGLELLENVKNRDVENPPLLFMTGFADIAFEAAYEKGVEGILSKPFVTQEILDRVTHLLTPVETRYQKPIQAEIKGSIRREFTTEWTPEGFPDLRFGRGGFSVRGVKEDLRIQDLVTFQFSFNGELKVFAGQGIVRWKRVDEEDGQKTIGVEFAFLEPSSHKMWLEKILPASQRPYIPLL